MAHDTCLRVIDLANGNVWTRISNVRGLRRTKPGNLHCRKFAIGINRPFKFTFLLEESAMTIVFFNDILI